MQAPPISDRTHRDRRPACPPDEADTSWLMGASLPLFQAICDWERLPLSWYHSGEVWVTTSGAE
jgi:hypothetical protein